MCRMSMSSSRHGQQRCSLPGSRSWLRCCGSPRRMDGALSQLGRPIIDESLRRKGSEPFLRNLGGLLSVRSRQAPVVQAWPEQPHPSPFHATRPSLMMSGTSTSAATGSAQVQPSIGRASTDGFQANSRICRERSGSCGLWIRSFRRRRGNAAAFWFTGRAFWPSWAAAGTTCGKSRQDGGFRRRDWKRPRPPRSRF